MYKKFCFFLLFFLNTLLFAVPELHIGSSAEISDFITFSNKSWANTRTTVSIVRKKDGLQIDFFAFTDGGKINVVGNQAASYMIFTGESVELQLTPDPSNGVYYHIGTNPRGEMYFARKKDISWRPGKGFVCRTTVGKDFWKAEFTIPFSAIDAAVPQKNSVWRANFGRYRYSDKNGEISSWCGQINYHDPKQHGIIRFGLPELPRLAAMSSELLNPELTIDAGEAERPLKIELFDNGKLAAGFSFGKNDPRRKKFSFAGIRNELPLKNLMERTIRIYDAAGKKLYDRTAHVAGGESDFFELDKFFVTQADKKIRFFTFANDYQLDVLDDNNRVCRTVRPPVSEIGLAGLSCGRYVAAFTSGRQTAYRVFYLRDSHKIKAPIHAKSRYAIKGSVITADGRPVYMFAGSHTPKYYLKHGNIFTLSAGNFGKFPGVLGIDGLIPKKIIRQPETGYLFPDRKTHQRNVEKIVSSTPQQKYRVIKRITYEANLPMFFPDADGRPVKDDNVKICADIYKYMRERNYPFFLSLQIDNQGMTEKFAPHCDIFEIACHGSYLASPLPAIINSFKYVQKVVKNKPVIHWLGVTIPNNHCRIAEELRAELFLSILHGGAGAIMHLGHGYLPQERYRLWDYISGCRGELDLAFELYQTGKAEKVTVPAGFIAALRRSQDGLYLIAVNTSAACRTWKYQTADGRIRELHFTGWESRIIKVD